MKYNAEKVDEAVLALLLLGASGKRAWRGLDNDVLDRLVEKGLIETPDRRSPTLDYTAAGLARAKEVFAELFAE